MPVVQDPDTSSTAGNAPTVSLTDSPAYVAAIEALKSGHRLPLSRQLKLLEAVHVDDLPADNLAWPRATIKQEQYILERWLDSRSKRTSWIAEHGTFLVKMDRNVEVQSYWCCKICQSIFVLAATSSTIIHLRRAHGIREPVSEDPADEQARKKARSVTDLLQQPKLPIVRPIGERFRELLVEMVVSARLPYSIVENDAFRGLLKLMDSNMTERLLPKSHHTLATWTLNKHTVYFNRLKDRLASSHFKKHLSFDLWTSPNGLAILSIFVHYIDSSRTLRNDLLGLWEVRGSHSGENMAATILQVIKKFEIRADDVGYFQSDNIEANDRCVYHILKGLYPALTAGDIEHEVPQRRLRCFGHVLNLGAKAAVKGGLPRAPDPNDPFARLSTAEEDALLREWRKAGPVGRLHNVVQFIRRSPQRRARFKEIVHFSRGDTFDEEVQPWLGAVMDSDNHSPNLGVVLNNATRWNSDYRMIRRAWRLRKYVDHYIGETVNHSDPSKRLPKEDQLSNDDWAILAAIMEVMKPFEDLTKKFETRAPLFSIVIPSLHRLIERLRHMRVKFRGDIAFEPFEGPQIPESNIHVATPTSTQRRATRTRAPPDSSSQVDSSSQIPDSQPPQLPSSRPASSLPSSLASSRATSHASAFSPEDGIPEDYANDLTNEGMEAVGYIIDRVVEKLKQYRDKMERCPAYWTACILHPGYRGRWVDRQLTDEEYEDILADFQLIYDVDYANQLVEDPPADTSSQQARIADNDWLIDHDFYDALPSQPKKEDELSRYLNDEIYAVDDVLGWWKANQSSYPRLSRMAFDFHSIPSMADDCERSFSGAKLTVDSQRHSLTVETINTIESTKFWLQSGLMGDAR